MHYLVRLREKMGPFGPNQWLLLRSMYLFRTMQVICIALVAVCVNT